MSLLEDINKVLGIAAPFASLIPGVGPYIGFAVKVVSDIEANHADKPGATKKELAMADLADAINVWNTSVGHNFNTSSMMTHISALIDAVVGLANDVQAFKHRPPGPAIPPQFPPHDVTPAP
jgi:hypothetical protein